MSDKYVMQSVDTTQGLVMKAPRLKLDNTVFGVSVKDSAERLALSLNSGIMLVKSMKSGEVKSVNVDPNKVLKNDAFLSSFEVRDARVAPKYNFSKADPGMVNIFAHKGPDENGGNSGWGRG